MSHCVCVCVSYWRQHKNNVKLQIHNIREGILVIYKVTLLFVCMLIMLY